jgi:hypothetical protein
VGGCLGSLASLSGAGMNGGLNASKRASLPADRNVLVDPMGKISRPSVMRSSRSKAARSARAAKCIFATFQTIAKDERRPGPISAHPRLPGLKWFLFDVRADALNLASEPASLP